MHAISLLTSCELYGVFNLSVVLLVVGVAHYHCQLNASLHGHKYH